MPVVTAAALALCAALFLFATLNREQRRMHMTNIETAAKQDVSSARAGIRFWMARHPFAWGAIACAVGALAVALVAVAL